MWGIHPFHEAQTKQDVNQGGDQTTGKAENMTRATFFFPVSWVIKHVPGACVIGRWQGSILGFPTALQEPLPPQIFLAGNSNFKKNTIGAWVLSGDVWTQILLQTTVFSEKLRVVPLNRTRRIRKSQPFGSQRPRSPFTRSSRAQNPIWGPCA